MYVSKGPESSFYSETIRPTDVSSLYLRTLERSSEVSQFRNLIEIILKPKDHSSKPK